MILHENRLPADDSHEISCLICYFWKSGKILNCRLLQIIGGALRVKLILIVFSGEKCFHSDPCVDPKADGYIRPLWCWGWGRSVWIPGQSGSTLFRMDSCMYTGLNDLFTTARDANPSDFCGIIPIFKVHFRITILNVKITANNHFKMESIKITRITPTSTLIISDHR